MEDRSKQAGILTGAEFIRFGFKSLIGIVLARILLPAELGTYRQLFLLYSLLSTLLLLGIPQSILYFLPKLRHPESKSEFITRAVNLISVMAFVLGIGIILFRGLIARVFNNPQLNTVLVIYAVYPLFMFVTQIYSTVMLGLRQPRSTALFTLFSVVMDLIFVLGCALLTKNLYLIVLGLMISAFIQWLYAQWQLRGYRTKVTFDPGFYQDVFRYALPLGLSSIVGMLTIQLDKLMISGIFRPEDFAVFSLGASELPFIAIFNNSVNSILLPSISGDTSKISEIFRAAVRKNALIIFPLAVLGVVFARQIITLLYTEQYLASVPYFQVYLLVLPLRVATYGILFMALQRTRYIMFNSLITLGLNLVLNFMLIYTIGMIGAAVATVLVTWFSVLLYMVWIKKKLHLVLGELFPWKAIVKTFIVALLAGLLAASVRWIFGVNWGMQAVSFLVFGVCFALLGRYTNAILPYDVQYLRGLAAQAWSRLNRGR